MDILLEDVSTKVAAVLAEIKAGVETARAAGLIAELPEKVDFTMNVITGEDALSDVTTETDTSARVTTTVAGAGQTTVTRGNDGETRGNDTEGATPTTEAELATTVARADDTESALPTVEKTETNLEHLTEQTGGSGDEQLTTYTYDNVP